MRFPTSWNFFQLPCKRKRIVACIDDEQECRRPWVEVVMEAGLGCLDDTKHHPSTPPGLPLKGIRHAPSVYLSSSIDFTHLITTASSTGSRCAIWGTGLPPLASTWQPCRVPGPENGDSYREFVGLSPQAISVISRS